MISVVSISIEYNSMLIEEKTRIRKPIVIKKDKLVTFSLKSELQSTAELLIFDNNNELLYEESFYAAENIRKTFDFSKVKSGRYYLRTKINDRFFRGLQHPIDLGTKTVLSQPGEATLRNFISVLGQHQHRRRLWYQRPPQNRRPRQPLNPLRPLNCTWPIWTA